MEEMRFVIDPERVIAEQFDGETVVVNLDTGAYYSLRGTAALVWTWIESGASPAEIARRIDPSTCRRSDICAFAASLQSELLVAPSSEIPAPLPAGAIGPESYAPPSFEKFTDMAELLLLDPIHDVAPMGWPAARSAADPPVTAG